MIAHINERLHVTLPEEEAGNIAFHLVNAQTENPNMEQTLLAVRMLKDIFRIVQFSFAHYFIHRNPSFPYCSSFWYLSLSPM